MTAKKIQMFAWIFCVTSLSEYANWHCWVVRVQILASSLHYVIFYFRFISFSRTLSAVLALEDFHCIRIETVSFYTVQTNRDVIGRKVISGRMCLKTSMVNILSDVKDTSQTFATAYQLLFLPFSCLRCHPRSTCGSNNQAVFLNDRIVFYSSPASFETGELFSNMADFLFPGRCHLDFFIVFSTNHRA